MTTIDEAQKVQKKIERSIWWRGAGRLGIVGLSTRPISVVPTKNDEARPGYERYDLGVNHAVVVTSIRPIPRKIQAKWNKWGTEVYFEVLGQK